MDEQAALSGPVGGWESEMQAYPIVVDDPTGRWMLYNGDGYGRTGVGLARWEA
jgi:hypothetical protein